MPVTALPHGEGRPILAGKKIRVLCVDDSALIRDLMSEIINSHDDMEVVAVAPDPLVARDLIKRHDPDVLTLDVEMPRMDGLDFLERLMRLRPMPVLMVSSLTQAGSEVTLRALELGAVDFLQKPALGIRSGMISPASDREKIRAAARSRPRHSGRRANAPKPLKSVMVSSEKLVILGASTGGPEAYGRCWSRCRPTSGDSDRPALPGGFTHSFALRLDKLCRITVKEAEDGERVLPGHAYIAPGDWHLKLVRSGANYVVRLDEGPPVNRHRPSVDVLFHSAATQAGRNAIGVLLTGMGKDGAAGLLAMRRAGATLAQDEDTSLVFGMPREAIAIGAATETLALEEMAPRMLALAAASGRAQRV